MPFAARVGDPTSHLSTPLGPGPGSFNVLIGGMPAWRAISDFHACTLTTPLPHVGGVVLLGSTTVFINNLPAARMGDTIIEGSPPNTFPNIIVMGCPTVLIG